MWLGGLVRVPPARPPMPSGQARWPSQLTHRNTTTAEQLDKVTRNQEETVAERDGVPEGEAVRPALGPHTTLDVPP